MRLKGTVSKRDGVDYLKYDSWWSASPWDAALCTSTTCSADSRLSASSWKADGGGATPTHSHGSHVFVRVSGEIVNAAINSNFKAFFNELKPSVERALSQEFLSVANKIVTSVPYDKLFPSA